jgi:E3 ubiquitin-protein ligase TRIP12
MLAALAAASSSTASTSHASRADQTSVSLSTSPTKHSGEGSSVGTAGTATVARRRSQRLRAKKASAPDSEGVSSAPDAPVEGSQNIDGPPSEAPLSRVSAAPVSEATPSETLIAEDERPEYEADFTDEEVDAEVFDDNMDATDDPSTTEKTITVNVADGTFALFYHKTYS